MNFSSIGHVPVPKPLFPFSFVPGKCAPLGILSLSSPSNTFYHYMCKGWGWYLDNNQLAVPSLDTKSSPYAYHKGWNLSLPKDQKGPRPEATNNNKTSYPEEEAEHQQEPLPHFQSAGAVSASPMAKIRTMTTVTDRYKGWHCVTIRGLKWGTEMVYLSHLVADSSSFCRV